MNLGIIIQARMESQRLPGKVYKKVLDKHLLEWVISRVKKAKLIKKIIVAIPNTQKSSILLPLIKKNKVDFYRGSLNNVLDRYIQTAEKFQIDPIIRITSDCPLIDPVLIDQTVKRYLSLKDKPDYFFIKGYPFGLGDIEIFKLKALKKISQLTKNSYHLEHVMPFIFEKPDLFKIKVEKAPSEFSLQNLRFCVDELPDLILVRKIFKHFKPREDFTTREILEYLNKNTQLAVINKNVKQKKDKISIAFIVKSDKKIGYGHLMRCKVLSKEFQQMIRCDIKFFPKIYLNKISNFDIFITDLPDINEEQLKQIKKHTKLLVSIDDGHKIKFTSDILVNPNINPKIKHKFSKKTKYFSGGNYIILKEEFNKFAKKTRIISKKPKQIFICFGGSDPNNLSEKIIRIIQKINLDKKIRIIIIVGFLSEKMKKIKKIINSHRNFVLQKNISNLAKTLWQSDLAVISGGTLMYEASILGIPSVIICQNREQFKEAEFFNKKEAVINLGIFDKLTTKRLKNNLPKLLENWNLRKRLSKNAKKLIDSHGTERIARIIIRELKRKSIL